MPLDLSSLKKAVKSFNSAIKIASSQEKSGDAAQKELNRAGVIQNFEFTYELCWKFMKRWLENNGEGASIDGATRKEVFRIAAEKQLITDATLWFEYTKARNETAHTYNTDTAQEVYKKSLQFLTDAEELLKKLESKND